MIIVHLTPDRIDVRGEDESMDKGEVEGIPVETDIPFTPDVYREWKTRIHEAIYSCMEMTGERPTRMLITNGLLVVESSKLPPQDWIIVGPRGPWVG